MKGIHLIAFLASWTVISASKLPNIFQNECPAIDLCPPKLISHEDCSKYYECKDGQKQLRLCATDLYFSHYWSGCVKKHLSDCPDPTPTVTPPPECKNGELSKHECKCEKFYECKDGLKALRECPAGQIFNPETSSCQPGNKDTCKIDPKPECEEGKNITHECQCHKYYKCVNGRKALRECDKGTHFDNVTLTCVSGENCTVNPVCVNDDKKPHECNCEKYYICRNGEWLVENCPKDLHFSKKQKKCLNPIDADCDPNIPGACPSNSPSKWPHECDCRLYYQCENGKKKIYCCSWGSYFDDANLKCDAAANVKNCKNAWDKWVK